MALKDQVVYRVYSCTNNDCGAKVSCQQGIFEKWRKQCPFCKKHSLLMEQATTNISTFIDLQRPKTLGGISDQNRSKKEREGLDDPMKPKRPFWRNKDKIDFNILKNPKKYIDTGTV
jgi:hypothetical protein